MKQNSQQTKDMFLKKAVERMLAERDIKKSYHSQLRKACEVALEDLQQEHSPAGLPASTTTGVLPSEGYVEADKYFLPFELACNSKSSKIVVIALDCLQKLIAYEQLTGQAPDSVDPKRKLIDRIVDAICGCFTGPNTDDAVQLQILKALLTIVTSSACEVHEASLVYAVRTTFNIFLAAKDATIQATAKASLNQMLNLIWSRMEADSANKSSQNSPVKEPGISGSEGNGTKNQSSKGFYIGGAAGEGAFGCDLDDFDEIPDDIKIIMEDIISRVEWSDIDGEPTGEGGEEMIGEEAMMTVTEDGSKAAAVPAKGGGTDRKSTDSMFDLDVNSSPSSPAPPLLKASVLERDCYLVFRALCRLSGKVIPDAVDTKSHAFKSKILSLELLLSVLQKPGPVFKSHIMYISLIKQSLCLALSRNGVSHILKIFELSLAIFLALLENFKEHLKAQVEVLFHAIFLNILETTNSSFEQKWLVMIALSRICGDAQSVVDIYINYDCDLKAANIFDRLILNIEKIALGRQAAELGAGPGQDRAIRLKGLRCLVDILRCMVDWSKSLYEPFASDPSDASPSSQESHPSVIIQPDEWAVGEDDALPGSMLPTSTSADTFEALKQRKEVIEQGIHAFNVKPRHGVAFMQEKGLIGPKPWDIAEFFHREDRLDKSILGDFLGDGDHYCRDIMWAYTDQMNFQNMPFLAALRAFLDGFRLPGEAQKIDRLMEKFASRFCENNPDHNPPFASADTAYVLAYSIIMLTTDLHTPQVKNKMTKAQYIKMNRGINDSEDLPESFLSDIYDQIAADKLDMKPSSAKLAGTSNPTLVANERQRRLLYNVEMNQMEQTAKVLMEAASHVQSSPFTLAKERDHVRPMFKIAWRPCIAAFSVGLQDSDDTELCSVCLDGFRCAIRIAGIYHMELERDAYVQALARFTLLTANSALSEMKAKNVDTIKTLILVAHTDGNYLGSAWVDILRCISQLELAQLIGTGVKSKFLQHHGAAPGTSSSARGSASGSSDHSVDSSGFMGGITAALDPSSKRVSESVQESLGETSSQSVIVAVDRIFTGSRRLDGNAIVEFVSAMAKVSTEELSMPGHPRMFALQKMVEISYYNMDRVRFVFSRIWQVLGDHFNKAGRNKNEEVATFAVDSLRQLSMKYFTMAELPNFRFQKDFLRPFEYIMKHNESVPIRDLVVRCMTQMVDMQANQIRSGWKNIFAVFHLAASDQEESIIELAFHTTSDIVGRIFAKDGTYAIDSFQEAIKTLAEFACNPTNPDMSMEAIDLIRKCANYVAKNQKLFMEHAWEDGSAKIAESERIWMRGWFPIIFEMSCIVVRCKLDVRTRALSEMFVIMKTYGEHFKPSWWKELFAVSCRIFDVMKLPEQQTEKAEWLMTTCNHALLSIVDVFSHYYADLHTVVLQDLYDRIAWCVNQDNEQLAKSGVECLGTLITSNGTKFTAQIWEKTVKLILNMFRRTVPHELLAWIPNEQLIQPSGEDGGQNSTPGAEHFVSQEAAAQFGRLHIKCVVQLELVNTLDFILFGAGTSRRDDERNMAEALSDNQNPAINTPTTPLNPLILSASSPAANQRPLYSSSGGLYYYLTSAHLFSLVDCLMESHHFAKLFNSNQNQRNVLWQAGFKGKEKPNLFSQERSSIACALRILFRMYPCGNLVNSADLIAQQSSHDGYAPQVQNRLIAICQEALSYFVQLKSEQHREMWTPVILLIFARTLRLKREYFNIQAVAYHPLLARLVGINTNPAIRALLARMIMRLPLCAGDC